MFQQTSQNSSNYAKQVHTWQRCYCRHDDINLAQKAAAWLLGMIFVRTEILSTFHA